jgi:DNA-binding transcriptional LysR family regulator
MATMLNIENLEAFGYITKYRNLSAAAQEMHLSQSTLSRVIASLESELKVRLFNRSTTPMELTPAGEIVLERSCVITSEYYEMLSQLKKLKTKKQQVVRMSGLLDSSLVSYIYKLKELIEKRELDISLKPTYLELHIPFNALRNGFVDIAFEAFSDMIDIHDLESIPLIKEQAFLVLEKDQELAKRETILIDDLKNIALLSLDHNVDHSLRKHVQSICRNHGFAGRLTARPSISRSNLFLTGFEGMGVLLPESMLKSASLLYLDSYVALPLEEEEAYFDLRAFYSSVSGDRPVDIIDCLKEIGTNA